ncbi:alanine--glyoxylate aminotransferase family protein [Halovulum dunhuangense]|uniref:Alanine--glyoxylate aminotransferase family protein n=1 Tax=Halovulum dunhuangense TaxID=1505036 RepID=A0A849L4S6_9RHOB|nr:aminotransferase class V-fold PLP-dependent enzyme [Halovulum dunhuangense]NNU81349.1 alanine--glyoxylate aminotransferase family protein [Halovulum dunhuangense]
MTLAHGRPLRAIPGPSILPDRVLRAMHRAAPNIYEGPLIEMTAEVSRNLRRVARTDGHVAMYIGNGHAAWEGALVNVLEPGDLALVLVNGRFALGWSEMARALGIEVELLDCGTEAAADPARLEARLRADTDGRIRAVLTTQTDTSTSVNNDIAALGAAIRAAGHDALFMVDCIASLACARFEMDAWGVDVMVAGCQKGLMTPPGMSFAFANDRALARRQTMTRVSPYFDWLPRFHPAMYYQNFCGTAPTHHVYGLHEALTMILEEEGLENVWSRHEAMAQTVWSAVDVWGETGSIRLNVPDPAHRSVAVTTIQTGPGEAERLRRWCEDRAGVTLGLGLGMGGAKSPPGDSIFRIGHMGHLNPPMLLGTLATIDAGLKALGIPHGGGALRVASETMARVASA